MEKNLIFNVKEWKCTDPDNFQFCREIDGHTFEYIQLKEDAIKRLEDILNHPLPHTKHLLETLNGKTKETDWWQTEIDATEDYCEEELNDILAPYGEYYLKGSEGKVRNMLIAEAIFETYVQEGIVENFEA